MLAFRLGGLLEGQLVGQFEGFQLLRCPQLPELLDGLLTGIKFLLVEAHLVLQFEEMGPGPERGFVVNHRQRICQDALCMLEDASLNAQFGFVGEQRQDIFGGREEGAALAGLFGFLQVGSTCP